MVEVNRYVLLQGQGISVTSVGPVVCLCLGREELFTLLRCFASNRRLEKSSNPSLGQVRILCTFVGL